jgi:hypothetical protein
MICQPCRDADHDHCWDDQRRERHYDWCEENGINPVKVTALLGTRACTCQHQQQATPKPPRPKVGEVHEAPGLVLTVEPPTSVPGVKDAAFIIGGLA